ncbi:uncharacterized protein IL334_006823 [Kwoniella shivajii]|uniref:SUN domain-containing protein n=1 Tax=Kwoniella shivajii TaxID=564305 RepID=A0ABZ1D705_9TREE|nr:hypothetical protein IL334_006823 [Kwoniella shivajii]
MTTPISTNVIPAPSSHGVVTDFVIDSRRVSSSSKDLSNISIIPLDTRLSLEYEASNVFPTQTRPSFQRLDSSAPLILDKPKRRRRITKIWLNILLASLILSCCIIILGWIRSLDDYDKVFDTPNPHHVPMSSNNTTMKTIMANSHNDEMQGDNALQLALSLRFGFIEIDTHLGLAPSSSTSSTKSSNQNNSALNPYLTLLAGHEIKDLNSHRTVKNLYFDPLLKILDDHNQGRNVKIDGWKGIYEDDSDAEVGILIDMKNDADMLWSYLIEALEPFLSKGYLTTYNVKNSTWSKGPLTIIGTGSTPLSKVYYSSFRCIFYDAPLLSLGKPVTIPSTVDGPSVTFEWDKTISPIASSKFPLRYYIKLAFMGRKPFICQLKSISEMTKGKGIKSRWWGVVKYPNWLKIDLWQILWESGQDILNVDDLSQARIWLENKNETSKNMLTCK